MIDPRDRIMLPCWRRRLCTKRLASWLEAERVTIYHSAPALFEQVMATGRTFDDLRIIRLEGDRAEPRQIAQFQARFGPNCVLVNGLGTTETGLVRQYFVTRETVLDGITSIETCPSVGSTVELGESK